MNESDRARKSVQKYQYGIRELFAAAIKQAIRDGSKPGNIGYEARLWLEFTAVPFLESLGLNTRAIYDFVLKTERKARQ